MQTIKLYHNLFEIEREREREGKHYDLQQIWCPNQFPCYINLCFAWTICLEDADFYIAKYKLKSSSSIIWYSQKKLSRSLLTTKINAQLRLREPNEILEILEELLLFIQVPTLPKIVKMQPLYKWILNKMHDSTYCLPACTHKKRRK